MCGSNNGVRATQPVGRPVWLTGEMILSDESMQIIFGLLGVARRRRRRRGRFNFMSTSTNWRTGRQTDRQTDRHSTGCGRHFSTSSNLTVQHLTSVCLCTSQDSISGFGIFFFSSELCLNIRSDSLVPDGGSLSLTLSLSLSLSLSSFPCSHFLFFKKNNFRWLDRSIHSVALNKTMIF